MYSTRINFEIGSFRKWRAMHGKFHETFAILSDRSIRLRATLKHDFSNSPFPIVLYVLETHHCGTVDDVVFPAIRYATPRT